MALACLLIEALQSFREAPAASRDVVQPCPYPAGPCIRPEPSTTELFKKFLRRPAFQGEFDDERVARSFIRGVRNGILHEAETRGWVIWREEPPGRILGQREDGYVVNRTEFCRALRTEFEAYLSELRDPANEDLRKRFLKKMSDVARES